MQVQCLGWEDPLEEGMATHSSILAWRIPMDREAWQATVHGVTKSWTRRKQMSMHAHRHYIQQLIHQQNIVKKIILCYQFITKT